MVLGHASRFLKKEKKLIPWVLNFLYLILVYTDTSINHDPLDAAWNRIHSLHPIIILLYMLCRLLSEAQLLDLQDRRSRS